MTSNGSVDSLKEIVNINLLKEMVGVSDDKEFEEKYVHKIESHHFKKFDVKSLKNVGDFVKE